ncbi:MAG: flagellin FliC [Methylococcaceae bacterium]
MALVINTNLGSINGQRNLNGTASAQSTAMQRLSSGVRVNSAKDDAAGLAIADRMMTQIRGMTVATRNANDGISLTQTAEGALGSLTDTLQRMRDLAVQSSSNAGVSDSDRAKMQTEFKALNEELLRVVGNSEFNGKKILNGDLAGGLNIQIGATTDTNSRISVAVSNMTTLLTPVTQATLYPKAEAVDSTLAASVSNAAKTAVADVQLKDANNSAKLATAAPNDLALAKLAATANVAAATALLSSSTNILTASTTNKGLGIVSDAFLTAVTVAGSTNVATAGAVDV